MTPAAWIMLGAAIASPLFTIVWWLIRRPVARIDRLEHAVFGDAGVHMKLSRYVSLEVFDQRVRDINERMAGISEEGQRREDRILEAIRGQTHAVTTAIGEVKSDLRAQNQRIDEVMRRQIDPR